MIEAQNPEAAWVTMSWKTVLMVFLVGAAVGLITYALFVPLEKFVFEPILCSSESAAIVKCGSEASFASTIAVILGSMVGLIFLVRERIFRPLLVVLAAALSLWGLLVLTVSLPWFVAAIITTIAFGIGYATFAWFAQVSNLVVALATVTVIIVAARLVLTA